MPANVPITITATANQTIAKRASVAIVRQRHITEPHVARHQPAQPVGAPWQNPEESQQTEHNNDAADAGATDPAYSAGSSDGRKHRQRNRVKRHPGICIRIAIKPAADTAPFRTAHAIALGSVSGIGIKVEHDEVDGRLNAKFDCWVVHANDRGQKRDQHQRQADNRKNDKETDLQFAADAGVDEGFAVEPCVGPQAAAHIGLGRERIEAERQHDEDAVDEAKADEAVATIVERDRDRFQAWCWRRRRRRRAMLMSSGCAVLHYLRAFPYAQSMPSERRLAPVPASPGAWSRLQPGSRCLASRHRPLKCSGRKIRSPQSISRSPNERPADG